MLNAISAMFLNSCSKELYLKGKLKFLVKIKCSFQNFTRFDSKHEYKTLSIQIRNQVIFHECFKLKMENL